MRVVPRRTVVGDIDRRFDNLSGSHHQSHVNCVSSVYGIYVSGQLTCDVIGCFKSNQIMKSNITAQLTSINLLAFYRQRHFLIGYATNYSVGDSR